MDEFYRERDMEKVLRLLVADPTIDTMSFKMLTFWGAPAYVADGWYLRRGADRYHRLFKWGPGYRYVKHRRPTVADPGGGTFARFTGSGPRPRLASASACSTIRCSSRCRSVRRASTTGMPPTPTTSIGTGTPG